MRWFPLDVREPHALLIFLAVSGVALVSWGLMHWAEKRWNRKPYKKRRLPR